MINRTESELIARERQNQSARSRGESPPKPILKDRGLPQPKRRRR